MLRQRSRHLLASVITIASILCSDIATPVAVMAKELSFQKFKCAIIVPDSGWSATPIPNDRAATNDVLWLASNDGLKRLVFNVMPVDEEIDIYDPTVIDEMKETIAKAGETIIEGKYGSLGGLPAYNVAFRKDADGRSVLGYAAFTLANGFGYWIIIRTDLGIPPQDDPACKKILDGFSFIGEPRVHHRSENAGEKGPSAYAVLAYASLALTVGFGMWLLLKRRE